MILQEQQRPAKRALGSSEHLAALAAAEPPQQVGRLDIRGKNVLLAIEFGKRQTELAFAPAQGTFTRRELVPLRLKGCDLAVVKTPSRTGGLP